MKHISKSLNETEKIASEWLTDISNKRETTDGAMVVGLSGHLGSGKTTFVQSIAKQLGIVESVTSPTFVIMKFYTTKHDQFKRMVHIDAYRLESGKDLVVLGFEKIVSDPNNIVFIEWPENVKEGLPNDCRTIIFETIGEKEREITI